MDTPITDKEAQKYLPHARFRLPVDFCRQLERELAAVTEQRDQIEEARKIMASHFVRASEQRDTLANAAFSLLRALRGVDLFHDYQIESREQLEKALAAIPHTPTDPDERITNEARLHTPMVL